MLDNKAALDNMGLSFFENSISIPSKADSSSVMLTCRPTRDALAFATAAMTKPGKVDRGIDRRMMISLL